MIPSDAEGNLGAPARGLEGLRKRGCVGLRLQLEPRELKIRGEEKNIPAQLSQLPAANQRARISPGQPSIYTSLYPLSFPLLLSLIQDSHTITGVRGKKYKFIKSRQYTGWISAQITIVINAGRYRPHIFKT